MALLPLRSLHAGSVPRPSPQRPALVAPESTYAARRGLPHAAGQRRRAPLPPARSAPVPPSDWGAAPAPGADWGSSPGASGGDETADAHSYDSAGHLPIQLLIAKARLSALEDFRAAAAAAFHAGPRGGADHLLSTLGLSFGGGSTITGSGGEHDSSSSGGGELSAGGDLFASSSAGGFAGAAGASGGLAEALAHVARLAAPSLEVSEVARAVQGLADCAQMAAADALRDAAAAAAGAAAAAAGLRQQAPDPPHHHHHQHQEEQGRRERAHRDSRQAPAPPLLERAAQGPLLKLLGLAATLEAYGFKANDADPFDPANTYIDTLLERRLGTPRSLALLWLAAARPAGLPLAAWHDPETDGVYLKLQLPGGFGAALADASAPGRLFYLPDAEEEGEGDGSGTSGEGKRSDAAGRVNSGAGAPWRRLAVGTRLAPAAEASRWLPAGVSLRLVPLSAKGLLGYALMDIKKAYLMTGLLEEALGIIRYMRALDPWSAGDLRDEGLVLLALGRHEEAYAPLATYLEAAGPGAGDAAEVREALARAEAALRRRRERD